MSLTIENTSPEIEHKTIKDFNYIPKYLDSDSIIEHSALLSFHVLGSPVIQDIYENNKQCRPKIFQIISPHILHLSFSDMGNYVIKKIIICDPDKSIMILNKLKNYIFQLAIDKHGTHVIQLLIEKIPEENLTDISKEFVGHYAELAVNQNGNQALQKLIKRQKKEENDKIFLEIWKYLITISVDKYGCYVLQELLNNCNEMTYNQIFTIICQDIQTLIMDQYGNYILSYFLEKDKRYIKQYLDIICYSIKGNIFQLSMNNFSVMIIEKVLKMGNHSQRKIIINDILYFDHVRKDCLAALAKDEYGNHVVQLILRYSDDKTRAIMVKKILSDPGVQKKEGYSAFVVAYIENELNIKEK